MRLAIVYYPDGKPRMTLESHFIEDNGLTWLVYVAFAATVENWAMGGTTAVER
jgi:hypothetical protein